MSVGQTCLLISFSVPLHNTILPLEVDPLPSISLDTNMPSSWTSEREQVLLLCIVDNADQISGDKMIKAAEILGGGVTADACR
jgi:hypothetical protein